MHTNGYGRRQLLKRGALAGGAVIAAPLLPGSTHLFDTRAGAQLASPALTGSDPRLTWAPPAGWESFTTRAVTKAEADEHSDTMLVIRLDPTVDYRIVAPRTIRRPVRIEGGRHVVWIGGHIRIDDKKGYDLAESGPALGVREAPGAGGAVGERIIHLEGILIDGSRLREGFANPTPTARVRLQNIRVGPIVHDSSDAWDGVNHFATLGWQHDDVIQTHTGHGGLDIDGFTGYTDNTGFQLDEVIAPLREDVRLRRVNIVAAPHTSDREGPLQQVCELPTVGWTLHDLAKTKGWRGRQFNENGTTEVTYDVHSPADPDLGAVSLRATFTKGPKGTDGNDCGPKEERSPGTASGGAVEVSYGTDRDLSSQRGMSMMVKLAEGGHRFSVARLEVRTGSDPLWRPGPYCLLEQGKAKRVVFPNWAAEGGDPTKVRGVRLKFRTGTSAVLLAGNLVGGEATIEHHYDGPRITSSGTKGIYVGKAGPVFADDVWFDCHPKSSWQWQDSGRVTLYPPRQCVGIDENGDAVYVTKVPPRDSTLCDFIYPRPTEIGDDGGVPFVVPNGIESWSGGPARVFGGTPPGGDFVPAGKAGLSYTAPAEYRPAPAPKPTATPTPVRSGASSTTLTVSWDAVPDATGYIVAVYGGQQVFVTTPSPASRPTRPSP